MPLCAGATGVGLVFSFLLLRRRGAVAAMRLAAWSLLPMAAYLTGALSALWTIGATAVSFVTSLVFNPFTWVGVALAGLSMVLFMVSGVIRARRLSAAAPAPSAASARPAAEQKPATSAPAGKPAIAQPKPRTNDDDFSDIEDILKRRGIS
ncbi:cellulose synthase [Nonomuraea africana]|uniref:Na+-transporting methylmalonyl-CoA/oxaloacetate decarboxylase gamma subunit n=1 Tax=Nonomuraea africana TaxID=46171 RepID=A0ABR9KF70_9ACTN|nr:cellulose synthase [Nonomuraea africana]MBE1560663.1 Na+-transporting methylmalonyl-CoA/oxaloacetate decarboxylase gamma subunit [Nonomuraea africana]